jgi:hypothetical protein
MRLHYFDIDGNYGNADKITVIGTGAWIREDFLLAQEAKDEDRYLAARVISEWVEAGRPQKDKAFNKEFKKFGLKPHKEKPVFTPDPEIVKEISIS